jgi:hypothetical protein
LSDEIVDQTIWYERNKHGYEISIVARLKGPHLSNVLYMVKLNNPQDQPIIYVLTLEGLKKLGELFLALHDFCKDPIFVREKSLDKLKELLTAEKIKNYADIARLKSDRR